MRLEDAEALARSLMAEHKLRGWTFRFDNAKGRFGACHYDRKIITLSRHLTQLNGEEDVRDTILHEIAHALAGRGKHRDLRNHGPGWRSVARHIGASGTRCCADKVHTPPRRWIGTCPVCGHQTKRHRRGRGEASCGQCSDTFDPRFRLVWTENDE